MMFSNTYDVILTIYHAVIFSHNKKGDLQVYWKLGRFTVILGSLKLNVVTAITLRDLINFKSLK
jgi:hypothetical protein